MDTPTRRLRTGTRAFFLATVMIASLAAAMPAIARAQEPPAQPTPSPAPPASTGKPQPKKNVVVVRGCLSGSMLTHTEAPESVSSVPETLRTTGSRAVRGTLKEIDGHTVELIGTLKGLGNQASGALVKDTGKTKIYVGGTERRTGQDRMMDDQRVELPTLDVSSVKDIAPQCNPAS
jgi:hypothetical protein